jgi:hypothetical protein
VFISSPVSSYLVLVYGAIYIILFTVSNERTPVTMCVYYLSYTHAGEVAASAVALVLIYVLRYEYLLLRSAVFLRISANSSGTFTHCYL